MWLRAGDSFRRICEEPFRIFFPAGIAPGILGISLLVTLAAISWLGAGDIARLVAVAIWTAVAIPKVRVVDAE
jgi:hypothetical protein